MDVNTCTHADTHTHTHTHTHTNKRVLTAMLLIMVNHTATFLLELQNSMVYLIYLESVLGIHRRRLSTIFKKETKVYEAMFFDM